MDINKQLRESMEEAGWKIGDYGDFLGLSEEERKIVELRIRLARTIRERRESLKLSQVQLAKRIGSSQSRVAKIEAAASGVSLDLMFNGLFALGGDLNDVVARATPKRARAARSTG